MANSKIQASALKDAYVSGIIDSSKLGLQQDQLASVHYDLNEGLVHGTNDNDPTVYVTNGYEEYPGSPRTRSIESIHPFHDANPVLEGVSRTAPMGAQNSAPLGALESDAIEAWHRSHDLSNRTFREPRFSMPGQRVN